MNSSQLFHDVLLIRRTEELILQLHSQGYLSGTTHTCIGQESVSACIAPHLKTGDRLFSTHRCHGHFLASGGEIADLLSELMGKPDGVSGGRGGSQHLHSPNFVSSGVQAQLLPTALGYSLSKKLDGKNAMSIVFIGDGTLGQGVLYETLNLASLWNIRLLVVLENNQIAQTTPSSVGVSGSIRQRAEAFGIKTSELDGINVGEMYEHLGKTISWIRNNGRPVFQIINTVRLVGHSRGDDTRSEREVSKLRELDPLKFLGLKVPDSEKSLIEEKVDAKINEERIKAENAPSFSSLRTNNLESEVFPPLKIEPFQSIPDDSNLRVVNSLNRALLHTMTEDSSVCVFGEDILDPYGGAFKVTDGISSRFPDRIFTTPISEAAMVGTGCGIGLGRKKAVVEIMFGDFIALTADQLINNVAKHYYLSQGRTPINIVVRTPMGGGRGYGPTHSQNLEKLMFGIPGLRVVSISSLIDPYYVLYHAIMSDPGPVLLIENKLVYREAVKYPRDGSIDGLATLMTNGPYPNLRLSPAESEKSKITIITYGRTASMCFSPVLDIYLEREIVVDLCVVSQLSPLNLNGILVSALESEYVLIVEEGTKEFGWGSEVAARLIEEGFQGQITRLGALSSPIPAAPILESAILPSSDLVRSYLADIASSK